MNIKLVLGIISPLLLIISLIVLSSLNVGFSIEKENVKSISYNSVFTNQNQAGEVKIQTITLKNDFFISKKTELTKIIACLYDIESKVKSQNLYVRYNEGKTSEIPTTPVASELGLTKSISYYYDYYTATRIVEVPAHSKKEVKLMVQPKYIYDYNYNNKNYVEPEFDEILVIEPKEDKDNYYSYYDSCANLNDKDIDNVIHIKITDIPTVVVTQPGPTASNNQQIPSVFISPYKNISECDKFTDIDKDNCYELVAIANKDLSFCDLAVNPTSKSGCYSSVAMTSGNYSICDYLPGNITNARDWCIANTAISRREKSACYNVGYQFARDKCFNSII